MSVPKVVGDIMTRRVVVLHEEENLELIEEGMERFGLRHLPVVDHGRLVGLVSHRDVLRVSVSCMEAAHDSKDRQLKQKTFVSEVMTRSPRSVREDTPLGEAAQILLDGRFGCLPVVDDDGTLVGIVTEHDFLRLTIGLLSQRGDAPDGADQRDAPPPGTDVG